MATNKKLLSEVKQLRKKNLEIMNKLKTRKQKLNNVVGKFTKGRQPRQDSKEVRSAQSKLEKQIAELTKIILKREEDEKKLKSIQHETEKINKEIANKTEISNAVQIQINNNFEDLDKLKKSLGESEVKINDLQTRNKEVLQELLNVEEQLKEKTREAEAKGKEVEAKGKEVEAKGKEAKLKQIELDKKNTEEEKDKLGKKQIDYAVGEKKTINKLAKEKGISYIKELAKDKSLEEQQRELLKKYITLFNKVENLEKELKQEPQKPIIKEEEEVEMLDEKINL